MVSTLASQHAEPVLVERRAHLLIVTMNRPTARNALNSRMSAALSDAFAQLDEDDELLVGVLTGTGAGFCAGLDLREFAAVGSDASTQVRSLLQTGSAKPVVAAIEGFAIAGGLELALMCDLIVAARGATLGLPEVTRALVANGGGLIRLPQRIPSQAAAEIGLTGDPMSAERLYELGLVNRLVEPGEAATTAIGLAERIARNPPRAVLATKAVLSRADDDAWRHQDSIAEPVFSSAEAREGARAFVERRAPAWERS